MRAQRHHRLPNGLIAALLLGTLALAAKPATAAFEAEFTVNEEALKYFRTETPTPARDFVNHVAVYVRLIPIKGNRVFPAFIDTHNYLTCPDSDQRWTLNQVKQVAFERRRGITVLGFFFDRPNCDKVHYHMEAVIGDS